MDKICLEKWNDSLALRILELEAELEILKRQKDVEASNEAHKFRLEWLQANEKYKQSVINYDKMKKNYEVAQERYLSIVKDNEAIQQSYNILQEEFDICLRENKSIKVENESIKVENENMKMAYEKMAGDFENLKKEFNEISSIIQRLEDLDGLKRIAYIYAKR